MSKNNENIKGQIIKLLDENNSGLKANEIATLLNEDKSNINDLLYKSDLKNYIQSDKNYNFKLKNNKNNFTIKDTDSEKNSDLTNLSKYYLSCLGYEDEGVSVFADSKYETDYSELENFPTNSEELSKEKGFSEISGKIRAQKSRHTMYIGYPSAIRKHKTLRWEGYFVEPIFLFQIEKDDNDNFEIKYPIINLKVLKNYSSVDQSSVMEEMVLLEEELGITNDDENEIEVPFDELLIRLELIRAEWPWKEKINIKKLNYKENKLSTIKEEGIYNKAVVVMTEKNNFTAGLELELNSLSKLSDKSIEPTSLGLWINGHNENKDNENRDLPLIDVLPMNHEQRQAVQSSLTKPLTIITGPPGTGKSQVVTNILANAAWHNKKVLFASKNNKAVDVVETRINALGSRPILLRLGSREYQSKLAEYLLGLLSTKVSEDEKEQYEDFKNKHDKLVEKINGIEDQEYSLIKLRNNTDKLEQAVEDLRNEISETLFKNASTYRLKLIKKNLSELEDLIFKAHKSNNGFLVQLFWSFLKDEKLKLIDNKFEIIKNDLTKFEIKFKNKKANESNLSSLKSILNKALDRINDLTNIKKYQESLKILSSATPFEKLSKEKLELIKKISKNSENLWQYWLKQQYGSLDADDRKKLNNYSALLKIVTETGKDQKLSTKVYREYNSISAEVSHLLPCWAVTSLSARGKIAFEPANYDIVVFDEASQCDIASALPLLYRAKSVVIIGDPMQLRHITPLKRGQDQALLEKYNLIKKFASWSYGHNSLYDLASGLVEPDNIINLLDHHRSHSHIINFSNKQFYESRLRVATNYDSLKIPEKSKTGLRWINIKGKITKPAAGSLMNLPELKVLVQELNKLVIERKYAGSIGVVTPYRAQANAIREIILKDDKLSRLLLEKDFLVDTIHKFQGDERDVMFFSPVLTEEMKTNSLGFLGQGNLFNVAITRARSQLIVVGDMKAALNSNIEHFSKFALYCKNIEKQEEEKVKESKKKVYGEKYPKIHNEEMVSDWEKILYSELYKSGIKTLPQYDIDKYRLDLALFAGNNKLDIEVDGERYHRNWNGELCRRDQLRNQRLFELGWDVMRFWVYEIRDDLPSCINKVEKWLKKNQ